MKDLNEIKKEYKELQREEAHWRVKDGSFVSAYFISVFIFIALLLSQRPSELYGVFGISLLIILSLKLLKRRRNNKHYKRLENFKEKHDLSEEEFLEIK